MNNLRQYITIVFTVLAICKTDAQLLLTDYQACKVEGDKVLLRWEPRSGEDWMSSKEIGYSIEKIKISAAGVEQSFGKEIIMPASEKEWLDYENSLSDYIHDFAVGARSFVHPDTEERKNQFDKVFDLKGNKEKGNKLSLGFLMYSVSYDFELAKLAGLAYEMRVEKGFTYKFIVRSGNTDPIYISVDPESHGDSKIPNLIADWGNKEVEIKWDASLNQGDYLGYMLSKSTDGVEYDRLNIRPQTNNLGLLSDTSALLQMSYVDSLEENNKPYWFKIEGFDFFGDITKNNQTVFGEGYDAIGISPIIEYANQTEDNLAHIKWYMPEEMNELVDRYRITRSDSDEGPYEIVIDSINKDVKEYKLPLGTTQNHFRVEAVPNRGKPVGSIPVFIMGQDTIPPAIPEIIGAVIDSLGVIELTWRTNTEQDLWGYRIFKSNFDEQEYALANEVISRDTIFRDTVDIKFNTENVFYKIYATDTRDNKSEFTLPVRVEKPDVFPPAMAGISSIDQSNDSLYIHWQPSSSNDVVSHHIFKRAINKDNFWALVGILENSHIGKPFIDSNLEYNTPYAYTIIAYDDAGLKSEALHPQNITLVKPREKFDPIDNVSIDYDEDLKEVILAWELKEQSSIEHILVYRGSAQNKLGKYKILNGDAKKLVEKSDGKNIFYKIKPIYTEQTKDYFSETVKVDISKS